MGRQQSSDEEIRRGIVTRGGKTTLIDQLADMEFQTVPEVGREYIEREKAEGRTIDEIRESEVNFVRCIKDMQLGVDEWLARDYRALGYTVVRVAVMPPDERLAFVLEKLSEQELI